MLGFELLLLLGAFLSSFGILLQDELRQGVEQASALMTSEH